MSLVDDYCRHCGERISRLRVKNGSVKTAAFDRAWVHTSDREEVYYYPCKQGSRMQANLGPEPALGGVAVWEES